MPKQLLIFTLFLLLIGSGCTPLVTESPTGRYAKEIYGTVALVKASNFRQYCSGTALAPRVIVTAAHCVTEKSGTSYLQTDEILVSSGSRYLYDKPFWHFRDVKKIYVHPGFPNSNTKRGDVADVRRRNDIALLVLKRPVSVPSVPLLPMSWVNQLMVGSKVTISGYIKGILYAGQTTFRGRSDRELWVGRRGEPYHAPGTSGGPVYVHLHGKPYLLGAASRLGPGYGSISTLVPAYAGWIRKEVIIQ